MNAAHSTTITHAAHSPMHEPATHRSGAFAAWRLPREGELVQNRLRVGACLGLGSTGAVYAAWDETLLREVALKFVHPDACGRGASLAFDEFEALIRVRHPSLPDVFNVSDGPHGLYLELERLNPHSLAELVEAPELTVARVLDILDDVASALDAIHAAGYVHRDVKAENVLFRGTRAVLVDLGLAARDEGLTRAKTLRRGSPAYLAPELVAGLPCGFEAWRRGDLYALAMTAFLGLTRQMPFEADSVFGALLSRTFSDAPRVCSLRPELPSACDAVMAQALSRLPSRRFRTAGEFTRALRAAVGA